ncbi:hypothetical protein Ait01nite_081750 [Actinoplanes italicus]|uniref:Uncharacterized protein n=1 Tax=Actinoplanes italicus TaxID=113567 RepID=A0A2T0K395_9ACTN|nr:hypothetical protein [Actinoplanes italicus]PRX17311.1 hypothetical protein CLV67_11687 [Actinoplanes italicus]GIE35130.1 hypothetical protein Ait01nite_081750 [Actinoplanes italicus]
MNTRELPRWVWAALIALLAVIVGIAAALLDYANGSTVPTAVLRGGTAFAGFTGLLLGVAVFLIGDRHR